MSRDPLIARDAAVLLLLLTACHTRSSSGAPEPSPEHPTASTPPSSPWEVPAAASTSAPPDAIDAAATPRSVAEGTPSVLDLEAAVPKGLLSLTFLPPDDARALSSGVDDSAVVSDLRTGRAVRRFRGRDFRFNQAAPTRDGRHVLTDRSGEMDAGARGIEANLWDLETGAIVTQLSGSPDGSSSLALSPDYRTAVTVTGGGELEFWDLGTARVTRRLERSAVAVGFSEDGGQAIWVDEQDTLCTLAIAANEAPLCHALGPKRRGTADVRMASVGAARTLTGSFAGVLSLWSNESGRLVKSWPASAKAINELAFLPQLGLAAAVAMDRTVRVWTEEGRLVAERRLDAVPDHVAISRDGRRVLYSTQDGAIHLWNLGPTERP